MARRFVRLRRGPVSEVSGTAEVPDNGMCLSVFLVIAPPGRKDAVLAGHIDPTFDWWEVGALDPKRVGAVSERWMLPSSQLLFFEGPAEAAERVLREQLGSPPVPLEGPFVFSDPSLRPGAPGKDPHWDVHFVFRGRWGSSTPPHARPWKDLAFVEVAATARAEFARDQGDVLELVGLAPRA